MKKINLQRGFTLIELLVVVAIIGILASVVLASLNSARTKGKDAAAISSMSQARAGAELAYSNNTGANVNSYTSMCPTISAAGVVTGPAAGTFNFEFGSSLLNAQTTLGTPTVITGIGAVKCGASATAYATSVVTNAGSYCVDSTGYAGTTKTSGAGVTVCS